VVGPYIVEQEVEVVVEVEEVVVLGCAFVRKKCQ